MQIPFQVDEVFTRYLDNSASGFAVYSGEDQHTTYAFDREGFRFTAADPDNPCQARPIGGEPTTPDPVKGLDANDELAFMAADAGPAGARRARRCRAAIEAAQPVDRRRPADAASAEVRLRDEGGARRTEAGLRRLATATSTTSATRTPTRSSTPSRRYDDYGNAAKGVYCDADGNVVRNADGSPKVDKRRPRDYATDHHRPRTASATTAAG